MKHTIVKDAMTTDPVIVSPETTLKQAACIMRDINIGILPVGREGKIKGIITDRDIVIRAISNDKDANEEMVKNYMSTYIHDCKEGASLEEAAEIMARYNVSRLIVTNKHDQPIGILSFGDIMRRSANIKEISEIVNMIAQIEEE